MRNAEFIDSENPYFTVTPLAQDSSPTINPQSAFRIPHSEDPRLTGVAMKAKVAPRCGSTIAQMASQRYK
jgi:hypothetical protein